MDTSANQAISRILGCDDDWQHGKPSKDAVRAELLGLDGSSDRRCIAGAKSGLHLGIWNDITTKISERADKSYATQVYVKGTFGATRVEEGKVVEIICDE